MTELMEKAIELAQETATAIKDNPLTDGSEVEHLVAELLEMESGVRPGVTEVAALVKEIVGDPAAEPDTYYLCKLKTREQLVGVPGFAEEPSRSDLRDLAEHGLTALPYSIIEREREDREAIRKADQNAAYGMGIHCGQDRNPPGTMRAIYDALVAYAKANGRTWKSQLRAEWEASTAGQHLQYLRNHPSFGPKGLAKFRLATETNKCA